MFAIEDELAQRLILMAAYAGALLIVVLLVVAYLLTLGQALAAVPPKRRTLTPGLVWLNLIPVFNLLWLFVTVVAVSRTLKRGYALRRVASPDSTFGLVHGLLAATTYPVSVGLSALFLGLAKPATSDPGWPTTVLLRVTPGVLFWVFVYLHGRQVGKLRKRLLTAEPGPLPAPSSRPDADA